MDKEKMIEALAPQVFNTYRNEGNYVFYCNVKPRELREGKDPYQSASLTSIVSLHILDNTKSSSVFFYLEGDDPYYLKEKIKANMSNPVDRVYTTQLTAGIASGKTIAEFVTSATEADLNTAINVLYKDDAKMTALIKKAYMLKQRRELIIPGREVILQEMKTPDNKKLDENGNTEVRVIKIFYNPVSLTTPYEVYIENNWAPPADGLVGAKNSKKDEAKSKASSTKFSEKEFLALVNEIISAKERYAAAAAASQMMHAKKYAYNPNSNN